MSWWKLACSSWLPDHPTGMLALQALAHVPLVASSQARLGAALDVPGHSFSRASSAGTGALQANRHPPL